MSAVVDAAAGYGTIDVSVVIPCLNEVRTVRECVAAAIDGIEAAGLCGEVIVADNGSTDGSVEAAEAAGARIVRVPRRGYGAALQAGFQAACGRLLVMGDADMSYDFRELPKLVEQQRRTNADMVLGDRLGGRIERGAMPWTHRVIGNPLISFTIRRLFHVPLNDCYCGLRLLTRESFRRLRLEASSMEFALEMIVQGALVGMRFAQVPITLHVDGRDKAPHLRTVRDGYRSFRFLFQHAPITLYGLVGGLAIATGLGLFGRAGWLEAHGGAPDAAVAAVGGALVLTGWFLGVLGIVARVFVAGFLGGEVDLPLRGLFRVARLETAVLLSLAMLAAGLLLSLGADRSQALFQLGLTLSTAAIGTFVGAFVVSLVGRAIPAPAIPAVAVAARPERGPEPVEPDTLRLWPPDPPDPGTTAPARRYDVWVAESLRPAWEGAGAVLDFGGTLGGAGRAIAEAGGPAAVLEVGPDEELRPAGGQADDGSAPRFDAAVSVGMIEHLDDDVAALRAMAARLRPGGRLGLVAAGGGSRLFGPADVLAGRCRRYTIPRLDARLRMAGFVVESIRPVDMAGAVLWFLRGRAPGTSHVGPDEVGALERAMPVARRIDSLLGPPFGLWLVAIASLPSAPRSDPSRAHLPLQGSAAG
jgi:SAM-dependent methyltransferase